MHYSFYAEDLDVKTYSSSRVIRTAATTHVDIADLRRHLNDFGELEESYLNTLLLTAQDIMSDHIGEWLNDTDIRLFYDGFCRKMRLDNSYVKSIIEVAYRKDDETEVIVDSSKYVLDNTSDIPYVTLANGQDSFTEDQLSISYENPVRIDYVAGLDSGDGFSTARNHALLLVCEDLHTYRGNFRISTSSSAFVSTLQTAERILSPYKRIVL